MRQEEVVVVLQTPAVVLVLLVVLLVVAKVIITSGKKWEIFKLMPTLQRKFSLKILGVIVAAGLVLLAGYWFFYYRPKQLLSVFQNQYQKGADFARTGDLNASIKTFESALNDAPSDKAAFYAKTSAAVYLFRRNTGDDRLKAVQALKDIIKDASKPPYQRGTALNSLLNFLSATRDEDFAKKEIFNDEPLAPFMKEGDVWLAKRRAYEFSYQLFPSPISAFEVAHWYRGELLKNEQAAGAQKDSFVSELKKWTSQGESLLSLMLKNGYPQVQIAFSYMLLGMEKAAIAKFSDGDYAPSKHAFNVALQSLGDTANDADLYNLSFFVRFNYAAMLAETFGEKHLADIHSLLLPISAPPPPQFKNYPFTFYEFLKNKAKKSGTNDVGVREILLLEKFAPEFKSFLDARGLKYQ